jgi:membrane protease YdiL (CAAX protease family)
MFLFFNAQNKLRAGWKIGSFLLILIVITFPLALAFDFLPETYRSMPFAFAISLPLASWISLRYIDQLPFKAIGLFTGEGVTVMLKDFGIGLFAGAFAMGIIALFLQFMPGFSFTWNPNLDYTKVLGFFLLMVAVGFYEELQVRGYILRMLSEGFRLGSMSIQQGFGLAALFTSFLFGALHIGNPNANWISTLNISLAGLLLVFPIAVTGRLYISFALHFSWNWFQAGLFGMPVSGQTIENSLLLYTRSETETLFSGGSFGPEAGLFGILGMILAALPVYIIYLKQNRTLRIFDTQFFAFDESETVNMDIKQTN